MKLIVLIILAVCVVGCGTLKTTALDEPRIDIGTKSKKSLCTQIPRVYSGVFYNACWLNRETNTNNTYSPNDRGIPYVAVDIVLSGLLDTLFLPYSIYKQVEEGSIKVDR